MRLGFLMWCFHDTRKVESKQGAFWEIEFPFVPLTCMNLEKEKAFGEFEFLKFYYYYDPIVPRLLFEKYLVFNQTRLKFFLLIFLNHYRV